MAIGRYYQLFLLSIALNTIVGKINIQVQHGLTSPDNNYYTSCVLLQCKPISTIFSVHPFYVTPLSMLSNIGLY